MKLKEAMEIVLDLAQQNVIDGGEETAAEEIRQEEAIEKVRGLIKNLDRLTRGWDESY